MSAGNEYEANGSLRSRAISEIRQRIQRQELPPEYVFSEVVMCQELAMSRAPVREALVVLGSRGWVEALPRAGWQVNAMTLNEVRDLLAVRAAIIPIAAAAAARRFPANELKEVATALAGHDNVDHVEDRVVAGYRRLRRIVRLSGNYEFDHSLEDVLARLVRYELLPPVVRVHPADRAQLDPTVEAILAGQIDEARARAADFVSHDESQILEAIIDSDLIRAAKISASSTASAAVKNHG